MRHKSIVLILFTIFTLCCSPCFAQQAQDMKQMEAYLLNLLNQIKKQNSELIRKWNVASTELNRIRSLLNGGQVTAQDDFSKEMKDSTVPVADVITISDPGVSTKSYGSSYEGPVWYNFDCEGVCTAELPQARPKMAGWFNSKRSQVFYLSPTPEDRFRLPSGETFAIGHKLVSGGNEGEQVELLCEEPGIWQIKHIFGNFRDGG